MAMRYENIIVFGPTGAVGGAAALEASKRGAKVWLAMRDTSKAIDGITSEQERDGKFIRVKADLSDPETVKQAVQLSGAKAAYVYLILAPGGIKGAVKAMKEAGVEYVVFLSSFTVQNGADIREIASEALIPYVHAQGEVALEDVDMAHTALRPGYFASNAFKMSMDSSKTPCEIYAYVDGKSTVDNIVPNDIGRVAGAVLVDRPSTTSKEAIYLYGPTLMSELEMCNTVKDFFPKEVKVIQQTPEEWAGRMMAKGFPPPTVQYLIKAQVDHNGELYSGLMPQEGAANIRKYSGYEPTSFEDFVKSQGNK
ncbi:hypothetical protein MMC28_007818 [Mycoblastus sanguinarius]|nr:hypothetical protein [Mycoblastus sanguinarius]